MPSTKGIRTIACFEAFKGMAVLIAGFGLLRLVPQSVAPIAEELLHHLHLNPTSQYPRIFLDLARNISNTQLWFLAALAFGYSAVRMAEAYGLWYQRRWAEWFAVASGGIYLPFEIYELFTGVSWIKVITLTLNVVIVSYMSYALWQSKRRKLF